MKRALLCLLLLAASCLAAAGPVYVVLWFDTEDYIEPASDDAALRIANDLTAEGVRATFKVVGEKARVLEARGRRDVIQALSRHAIGYHSNWHSVHPAPAEYLLRLGFLEGADEFERREAAGIADIRRIFGTQPICYGQPGNSWAPQANPALRRLGVPVYLDEGDQVGVDEQPFWYGGLLYVFHMGRNQFRAQLNVGAEDPAAYRRFDEAAERLASSGGGTISIYYHPTEFVTTEFWDAVNFAHGANPPRDQWGKPRRRTPEESERCYGVLRRFVQHMKARPGVRFVTANDLLTLYANPPKIAPDRKAIAAHLKRNIVFAEIGGAVLSPAEMLAALLGKTGTTIDGPTAAGATTYEKPTIPAAAFQRASADAAAFIDRNGRLPNEVSVGAGALSLADFAATLAGSLEAKGEIAVAHGNLAFDRYFATDGHKSYNWVIHPDGFDGSPLLATARLQGWTLKPARLAAAQPARPIAELMRESLTQQPPAEPGPFTRSDLVDLARLDPRIRLDIRYATSNNFLGTPVYTSARAFLQRPAAEALLRAQRELARQGYGLLIFDAYRPWHITKVFWDATPPEKHEFVADPSKGSRHNRGCAVDLTLYDLKTGREVEMTGGYDEMTERSYPTYTGGTAEQRARRDLLRRAMEKQGFTVYETEWWHFDYRDWQHYAIQNVPFEQMR